MIAGDRVRVETFVRVPLADAFAIFTAEIDQWWRRGRAYRIGGRTPSIVHLEPRLGGRVFEAGVDGAPLHVMGRITIWEPPAHLAFEWRGVNFAPGELTTVELWFEARGAGTRVVLEHRGFAALPDDHPVRHGQPVVEFIGGLGRWWGGQLTRLRELAEDRVAPG